MSNLPQRKRIRLQGYDYSQNGTYFITICTKNRAIFFGAVNDGMMILNPIGEIANRHIKEIKKHIVGITVANYVVMPNHIHMILTVDTPSVGTRYIVSENQSPCIPENQSPCIPENQSPCIPEKRTPCIPENQSPCIPENQSPCIPENQSPCIPENQSPCIPEKRTPCMASLQEKSKQTIPKTIQQFKASVSRETQAIGLWQPRYHDHIIRNEQEYQKIWDYIDTNPLKWEEDCFYAK